MSAAQPTRVCLFDFRHTPDFVDYELHTFQPLADATRPRRFSLADVFARGRSSVRLQDHLHTAEGIDRLYRNRDPDYMRMVNSFVERFADFDVLIMGNYNPIHPEVLHNELPKPIKVLGFIDDPDSSYVRGIPYLWAFDGAFFISPSYDERTLFADKLTDWGCPASTWWPLRPEPEAPAVADAAFFANRDVDLIYIGNAYGPKVDRLVRLRQHFGKRLRIHGRWPLRGYYGMLRGAFGRPVLWHRVASLGECERTQLYWRARIGFNMHLSEVPRETGNMRMYEVPAHGALLLSDRAGCNAHEQIFAEGREAVYYDTIQDAIDKAEYYLAHEQERQAIARAGLERLRADYDWEAGLRRLLDWARALPRQGGTSGRGAGAS